MLFHNHFNGIIGAISTTEVNDLDHATFREREARGVAVRAMNEFMTRIQKE